MDRNTRVLLFAVFVSTLILAGLIKGVDTKALNLVKKAEAPTPTVTVAPTIEPTATPSATPRFNRTNSVTTPRVTNTVTRTPSVSPSVAR